MAGIAGELLRYGEETSLVAFITHSADRKRCSNALVLVVGLGDGFLSLNYSAALSEHLRAADYDLVLVNLSSSWGQFGFRSLASDACDLGAQDVLYFLRHAGPEKTNVVNGVVLQGAVSDRECLLHLMAEETTPLIEEAKALAASGKEDAILSRRLLDAPITAYRLLSLTERLADDDMFSTDLTSAELEPILQPVKIPIFLCFSEQDQYVPDIAAQKQFALTMADVLKKHSPLVHCQYYSGDHGLSKSEYYGPFVKDVVKFVSSF